MPRELQFGKSTLSSNSGSAQAEQTATPVSRKVGFSWMTYQNLEVPIEGSAFHFLALAAECTRLSVRVPGVYPTHAFLAILALGAGCEMIHLRVCSGHR